MNRRLPAVSLAEELVTGEAELEELLETAGENNRYHDKRLGGLTYHSEVDLPLRHPINCLASPPDVTRTATSAAPSAVTIFSLVKRSRGSRHFDQSANPLELLAELLLTDPWEMSSCQLPAKQTLGSRATVGEALSPSKQNKQIF